MNFELTEETLEEGRFALHQLEKQLNQRNTFDNASATSSKHQSTTSERKILDQIPRNTRLNLRLESLGITVEGLEDRGLLEGGGAVPSYYTSMKQKGRRILELQPRAHRLQERGKESVTKVLSGALHMIRILIRRGLQLADYCHQRDPAGRGLFHKKVFLSLLKQIGLPYSIRELADITQHYIVTSSEQVDYLSFLRDVGIADSGNFAFNTAASESVLQSVDIHKQTAVLTDVKRMLVDSIQQLNKHPDDVYRMFARWDTQGTGTVTATQLLRVLAKLHVTLAEVDQDFLVELLDTDAKGRVDFEILLSYCFSDADVGANSHVNLLSGGGNSGGGAFCGGDDTLSAVSTDGNYSTEQKSLPSIHNRGRPHTATLSRPFSASHNVSSSSTQYGNDKKLLSLVPSAAVSHSSQHSPQHQSRSLLGKQIQRPFTASGARTVVDANFNIISGKNYSEPVAETRLNKGLSRHWQQKQDMENHNSYVRDRADDVINDEDVQFTHGLSTDVRQERSAAAVSSVKELNPNISINDNTLCESNLNNDQIQTVPFAAPVPEMGKVVQSDSYYHRSDDAADPFTSMSISEPIDHLDLLAQQILSALRDIINTRYRRGKSLQEIFLHFDRAGKGSFDSIDFARAASDLRIETSDRVASIALKRIALDSKSKVCFGEFKVFVLDSDHHLLERNLQEQLAGLYEQEGRQYRDWMEEVFWSEEVALGDSQTGSPNVHEYNLISRQAFLSGLQKIGAKLTSSELNRIADRFDIHGEGSCCVTRFLRMIRESTLWRHSEHSFSCQDEAIEEAAYLRQLIRSGSQLPPNCPQLSDELINICEYLGIRVLTEQHMLWIASDALKAPLPVSWSAQKDKDGRTYFYNNLTNQAKWEHPLDPHFRNLRDKYRQSSNDTNLYTTTVSHPTALSTSPSALFQSSHRPHLSNFPSTALRSHQLQSNEKIMHNGPEPPAWRRVSSSGLGMTLTHHAGDTTSSGLASKQKRDGSTRPRPLSAPNNANHSVPAVNTYSETDRLTKNVNNTQLSPQQTQTEMYRALMESVYSAPYLKTPIQPAVAPVTANNSGRDFERQFVKDSENNRNTTRPSSSSGLARLSSSAAVASNKAVKLPSNNSHMVSSKRSNGPSVVERVVNYGKNNPSYLLPRGEPREKIDDRHSSAMDTKNSKFGKYFAVNVLDRLDNLMEHNNN